LLLADQLRATDELPAVAARSVGTAAKDVVAAEPSGFWLTELVTLLAPHPASSARQAVKMHTRNATGLQQRSKLSLLSNKGPPRIACDN